MSAKYTRRRKRGKADPRPAKPKSDFPLYAHRLGYWSAKVNGRTFHFGRWGRVVSGNLEQLPYEENWRAALATYQARKEDAKAGRITDPVVEPISAKSNGKPNLGELCDKFLHAKRQQMDAGSIGARMFDEYRSITDLLTAKFGIVRAIDDLTAADFQALRAAMAEKWGPVRLTNQITRVKTVFKFAYEFGLLDRPIPCLQPNGTIFARPSDREVRKARNKNGKKFLEANECRALIDAAPVDLRAMILLGLNCGFGNHDCAMLPLSALDLNRGWINFPRPKTAIDRRVPLWPETVAALREAIAARPAVKDSDAEALVFVTSRGRPWLSNGIANPVSVATRALMKQVGIHRPGIGHYTLRHVFRTTADEAGDQVAANAIMGHVDASMANAYREKIADERLQKVVNYVRAWLFNEGVK